MGVLIEGFHSVVRYRQKKAEADLELLYMHAMNIHVHCHVCGSAYVRVLPGGY